MKRLFLLLALFAALPAAAQQMPGASKEPIEISAAHSLEWNRKNHTYVARREAMARQGAFSIRADLLTARYNEKKGATTIYELVAEKGVVIADPPYTAYGDKAVYTVDQSRAVLTGQDLRIVTPTESLKARDSIEFFGKENRLAATGDAFAVRGTDSVKADVMEAFFEKDPKTGKLVMTKVTGRGNVVVKTARETVQGDKGIYNIAGQKAVLTGRVRLNQGENWLEGTRADVDLKTGISQLIAEGRKETEGRVKGVFYPKESGGP
jgi:lipopolysaccharide export system protein LptA